MGRARPGSHHRCRRIAGLSTPLSTNRLHKSVVDFPWKECIYHAGRGLCSKTQSLTFISIVVISTKTQNTLGKKGLILIYNLLSILKDEAALRSPEAQGPGKNELGVAMGNITVWYRFLSPASFTANVSLPVTCDLVRGGIYHLYLIQ